MAKGKSKGKAEADVVLGEPTKPKPTMYLTDDDALDGAEVGQETTLTVKAKCKRVSKSDGNEGTTESQDWEILGIERTQDDPTAKMARKVQTRGW